MGRVGHFLPSFFSQLLRMPFCLQECCKDTLALIIEMTCFFSVLRHKFCHNKVYWREGRGTGVSFLVSLLIYGT